MKIENIIRITIGETTHELTADEARALVAELQKSLPMPNVAVFRNAVRDCGHATLIPITYPPQFPQGETAPWQSPADPWPKQNQPLRVFCGEPGIGGAEVTIGSSDGSSL